MALAQSTIFTETGGSSPADKPCDSTGKSTKSASRAVPLTSSQRLFRGVSAIEAIAYWVPDNVVTVEDMKRKIKVPQTRALNLQRSVGLQEKRVIDDGMSVLDTAKKAIDALLSAGSLDGRAIPVEELDAVIYFGLSRQGMEPSTSIMLQQSMGLSGVLAFDVVDACLGFTDAWYIVDALIASGRIRKALLIGAENLSPFADTAIERINAGEEQMPHMAALTLADGAAAIVIGHKDASDLNVQLKTGIRETYSEYFADSALEKFGAPFISYPANIFAASLANLPRLSDLVLEDLHWNIADITSWVPHQASAVSCYRGAKLLGVRREQVAVNFPTLGNIASVSIPLTLAQCLEKHCKRGDKLLSVGLGAGLGMGLFGLEVS